MYSIKHLFHIEADINTVYQNIATISGLKEWWTVHTYGSSKINGTITFKFPPHFVNTMKVIDLQENKLVKWKCLEGADDWIDTEFTFVIDENDHKTRLRFEHSHWRVNDDFYASCSFSWGRYLESLRQLCELGKGQPFKNH